MRVHAPASKPTRRSAPSPAPSPPQAERPVAHGPRWGLDAFAVHAPDAEAEADRMASDVLGRRGELAHGFEQRFGVDLSNVRLHTGPGAAAAAQRLSARAFTVGSDIFFDQGELAAPGGRALLAHELGHAVQQARDGRPAVQCQRRGRAPTAHPSGPDRATAHRDVRMTFDGSHLVVLADGVEVFRFSAQSGHPTFVEPADIARCGGDPELTYMNPRYVGVHDKGPIPEGTYHFDPATLQHYTFWDELRIETTHVHAPLSTAAGPAEGGDWGSGRVALHADHIVPSTCGDSTTRSGFFLHGGWMGGSSGCIDIGTSFDTLADWLAGFRRPVPLTVHYTDPPGPPGYFTGLSGMMAYGANASLNLAHGPHVRAGVELGRDLRPGAGGAQTTRFLASAGYDLILRWAGGAIAAGARLDVPLDDREQFVRLGLEVSTNFRLFRSLYGTLTTGYVWPIGEPNATPGWTVGGGLGVDLGRWHVEALYDVLQPASSDQRVQQVLVGLGVRL